MISLYQRLKQYLFGGKSKERRIVEQKGWWTSIGGPSFRNTYDAFHGQKEPSKAELVKAYDDIVYACVSLISQNLAAIPIRLYVRTDTGQPKPQHRIRAVTEKNLKKIRQKYMGSDVKEVIDHPALDLINNANSFHNKRDLIELTDIYLETTGNSFWHIKESPHTQKPASLFVLPSQYVTPKRDDRGYVEKWLFGSGLEVQEYDLKEVIHFQYLNPMDPYGEGLSPLRAAWGRQQISAKELSYLDNYLSNQGKPDAVLALKESLHPEEAERVAKEYYQRYQGQGAGGLLVVDGSMNLVPLNFPAKDLAELQVYQVLKTVICNCYRIPPDIFELGSSSNRSTREAALYSFKDQCLQPRIDGICEKLTDKLLTPYYDDRLFFSADDIVPQDKEFEQTKLDMLLRNQVITRDEARVREGYPSVAWAREPLLPSGVMPPSAFDEEQVVAPAEPVEKDRSGQASQVQALQQAYFAGQILRPAALANAQLLFGFTAEEAAALFPELPEQQGPIAAIEQEPGTAPAAPGQAEGTSNDLRATVGGSQAIADLQRSYYRRELPREAAIANARLIFGFSQQEAEALFPELVPDAPQAQQPQQPSQDAPGATQSPPATQEPVNDQGADEQQQKGLTVADTGRFKMLKQVNPAPLVKALQGLFRSLGKEVMADLPQVAKAVPVIDWFSEEGWADQFSKVLRPVLSAIYHEAARETLGTLNLTPSMFQTVQPKLAEGVQQATTVLCAETLATTRLALDEAMARLKQEITEGLEVGDVKNELMKRVQMVFQEADNYRAFRIGVTEASRGQHEAALITAEESGVVEGKTWLLSDDACPICKPLDGKTVGLKEVFTTDGTGPYSRISAPPRHPNCRCTLLFDTGE